MMRKQILPLLVMSLFIIIAYQNCGENPYSIKSSELYFSGSFDDSGLEIVDPNNQPLIADSEPQSGQGDQEQAEQTDQPVASEAPAPSSHQNDGQIEIGENEQPLPSPLPAPGGSEGNTNQQAIQDGQQIVNTLPVSLCDLKEKMHFLNDVTAIILNVAEFNFVPQSEVIIEKTNVDLFNGFEIIIPSSVERVEQIRLVLDSGYAGVIKLSTKAFDLVEPRDMPSQMRSGLKLLIANDVNLLAGKKYLIKVNPCAVHINTFANQQRFKLLPVIHINAEDVSLVK